MSASDYAALIAASPRDRLDAFLATANRLEIDDADQDGQTLLILYPEVEPRDEAYVRPVVRIESGAKSALDPNEPATIRPYVADDVRGFDLTVPNVTTIQAARTFWDKLVIAHGLRLWYDRRGVLRQEGSASHATIMICTVWRDRSPEVPPNGAQSDRP